MTVFSRLSTNGGQMMQILNTYIAKPDLTEVITITVCLFVFAIVTYLYGFIHCNDRVPIIVSSVLIVMSIVILAVALIVSKTCDKTRYEAILDDGYSVQSLYDNYIVVEQRGKIWVLEDRK